MSHRREELERLLVTAAAASSSSGTCPADELLVGYVEHRLGDEAVGQIEAHLASCAECRREASELADDLEHVLPGGARTRALAGSRSTWHVGRAIAATVLLAFGVWYLLLSPPPSAPPPALEARVQQGLESLQRVDASWGDVELLSMADLAQRPAVARSSATWVLPTGTVDADTFEPMWELGDANAEVHVTVTNADGQRVLDRQTGGTLLPWPREMPPLAPGAYVIRVEAEVDLESRSARSAFLVATAEEQARYVRRAAQADQEADPVVRLLLRAHVALEEGRVLDALAAANAAADRSEDPYAGAMLAYTRARAGWAPEER
ncbi:MAG: zf-HC2 domain-containing protein [Planctomycetota bacterium]